MRVLKPTGSLWLNLGDTYRGKRQLGVPWRVAFHLTDEQGWTLRNSVVWHKVKGGPDTSRDKLRNVHELLFHFVRRPKGYYYDADAVRRAPRAARVENGAVVSATGVSGVRYRRQIELSTSLDELEKAAALAALEETLGEVAAGRLADFRMVIRGRQRATHSDVGAVSGRARELEERGFCFLRYHPRGAKPGDVWDILPEDTQGRGLHFAPFPADLCRIPILATCPPDGVVLDPFCGTGTAMLVAAQLGRRSVGIDLAEEYLALARERTARALSRSAGRRVTAPVTSCSIRAGRTRWCDEEEPAHARGQHQRRGRGAPARARRRTTSTTTRLTSRAGGASRRSRSSRRSCSPSWRS